MMKDKKAHPERMETKKYCKFCKSHTMHKETKQLSEVNVMGEKTKNNAPKTSWFKGLKAEFKKIVWPDKKTLGKQTAAVVFVSVVLGAVITIVDIIAQYGIDLLVK